MGVNWWLKSSTYSFVNTCIPHFVQNSLLLHFNSTIQKLLLSWSIIFLLFIVHRRPPFCSFLLLLSNTLNSFHFSFRFLNLVPNYHFWFFNFSISESFLHSFLCLAHPWFFHASFLSFRLNFSILVTICIWPILNLWVLPRVVAIFSIVC